MISEIVCAVGWLEEIWKLQKQTCYVRISEATTQTGSYIQYILTLQNIEHRSKLKTRVKTFRLM